MVSTVRRRRTLRRGVRHVTRIDIDERTGRAINAMCHRPRLTQEEEDDLARRAQAGDIEAANELALSGIGLAISWATSYAGRGVMFEDLAGAAILATVAASRSYKPIGRKFISYAAWKIAGAIRMELSRNQGAMSFKGYPKKINSPATSIDQEIGDGLTIGDSIVDEGSVPVAEVEQADLEKKVREAVASLPAAQREIIERRWLSDGGDNRLRTIGEEHNRSHNAIFLTEQRAMQRLFKTHGKMLRDLLK